MKSSIAANFAPVLALISIPLLYYGFFSAMGDSVRSRAQSTVPRRQAAWNQAILSRLLMRPQILTIIFILCLSGCATVFQIESEPSSIEFDANYDSGDDYILITLGHPNRPREYKIIAEESHVLDPRGISHPIKVTSHSFDLSEHYPNVRDDLIILRSDKSSSPVRPYAGKWVFVLTLLQSNQAKQVHTFAVQISKGHYSPFFDGPSN